MADTPTTATPAPTTSFWSYLTTNWPNHFKLFGGIAVIVLGIIAYNYIRDLQNEIKNEEQVTATLQQKYQQAGTSAVAANSQQAPAQITAQAAGDFGAAVMGIMQADHAQINSLTTLVAKTQAEVNVLGQQKQTAFTPQQQATPTGALTGYPLEETRKNGPPLASVDLFYDPKQTDPNKAFQGTKWDAYQEEFHASVGNWQKQKTGGFSTTLALTRTVSKPDPNDPTKMVAAGTETIPITGGNTIFTPKGLLEGTQPTVPRWTVGIGLSKGPQSSYQPFGQLDYRLTDRFGIFAGAVNNNLLGGVSIRLDTHKN